MTGPAAGSQVTVQGNLMNHVREKMCGYELLDKLMTMLRVC